MTTQLGRGEVHGSVATHVVRATYIVLTILILSPASRSQTIISYNAGKAGEPPTAPDPTRQGWTFGRTGAHTELTAGPVSPDGTTGLNAWNVSDRLSASPSNANGLWYNFRLTNEHLMASRVLGWTMTMHARFVDHYGGHTGPLIEFTDYYDRRYVVFYESSGEGHLVGNLWGRGRVRLTEPSTAKEYHTHVIQYDPSTDTAAYYIDNVLVVNDWRPEGNPYGSPGVVTWGAASSLGTGSINYNHVTFRIGISILSPDVTGDYYVDLADFATMSKWWLCRCDEYNGWCEGADLQMSGFVGVDDLSTLLTFWLTGDRLSLAEDMVPIPCGIFEMGDSCNEGNIGEQPVHTVTMSAFYMNKYETTNAQYCQFLNSALSQGLIGVIDGVVYEAGSGTPTYPYCDTSTSSGYSQISFSNNTFTVRTKGGRSMANDPMVEVSWCGAVVYCNWRSQQEGLQPCYDLSTWNCDFNKNGYHLPTEAQWEYAARGGLSGKRFPWGDTITHNRANYHSSTQYGYDQSSTLGYHPTWNDGIYPYTSPAGWFAANGYGLYDMAGNVWEWCNDWYGSYSSVAQTDPTGPTTGGIRVLRGGYWRDGAYYCRVAYRIGDTPDELIYYYGSGGYVGFRVCR